MNPNLPPARLAHAPRPTDEVRAACVAKPMRARSFVVAASMAACLSLLLPQPAPADSRMKCWTNSDGIRECGDVIPPEYTQQSHETLNSQGITVEQVRASRTRAEIEAEQAEKHARETAERARKAKAERAAERDRILFSTYNSIADLEIARESQLEHIDTQISSTEKRIEKLEQAMAERVRRAAQMERQGRVPPDSLTSDIAGLRGQIDESRQFITDRREERSAVDAQFGADIERYLKLAPRTGDAGGG
jgi:hypothetical protein